MFDIEKVKEDHVWVFDTLVDEVTILQREFKATTFYGHLRNFPHAHYGYLMACMGKIDLLSLYWQGPVRPPGQTARMVNFIDRYIYPQRTEENRVIVQMFRHTLMHTGALRFIYDKKTNIRYTWYVAFTSLPTQRKHYTLSVEKQQHAEAIMTKQVSTGSQTSVLKSLNVNVVLLAEDVRRGFQGYLADLSLDSVLQANYAAAEPMIDIQEFN